jgi:ureidoglycolate hydrolase
MSRSSERTVRRVTVERLSTDAFEPYGTYVERPRREPDWVASGSRVMGVVEARGTDAKIAQLWHIGDLEFDQPVFLGSVRYYHQGFVVAELERHRGETQTWIATRGTSLLVVAPATQPGEELDVERLRIFVVEPGDVLAIGRGVWMCHFLPLGSDADYVLVSARREPEQDRDLVNLARTRNLVIVADLAGTSA